MNSRPAARTAAAVILAACAAAAVPQDRPAEPGRGGSEASSIEVRLPGGTRLSARFPALSPRGVEGARLGTWLSGFVLSLLHETMAGALEAFPAAGSAAAGASLAAWERQVDYKVVHEDADYVSVVFTDYSFTGGAHGNTGYHTFVFMRQPAGWQEVALADLLLPGPEPLDRLSDLLVEELKKKGAALVKAGTIKAFGHEQLRCFAATPKALTFYFAPYEVGPYSDGSYEAAVALDALAGIVRPDALALLRE